MCLQLSTTAHCPLPTAHCPLPTDQHNIGLDLGTSAIKGVLVDAGGQVLATAARDTSFLEPQDGRIEVDPEAHYQNVCRVIRELSSHAPGDVRALAMAGASGNTLLTDDGGVPLTNIINWMDQRAVQHSPAALTGLTSSGVADIAGWPCVSTFPLGHLAWLRENCPDVYRRAGHFGMDTDWLLHRLTGEWVMDYSTATTFHLQDQTSLTYHQPFLKMLEIPEQKLSRLTGSGVPVGVLTERARCDTGLTSCTTVVTGCFDHPAAARSSGVLKPGQLMLSCGTSWVGFTPFMERRTILAAGLLCDPFLAPEGGPWGGIFSVPYIGRTIDAYVRSVIAPGEADPYAVFNEAAAAATGTAGLELDLREPVRAVSGSPEAVSRAVMEGAAKLLCEKMHDLQSHGFMFDQAVLVGGPSKSPVWPGIIAEMSGLKLTVGSEHAGARGAAMLAAAGSGGHSLSREGNGAWNGR